MQAGTEFGAGCHSRGRGTGLDSVSAGCQKGFLRRIRFGRRQGQFRGCFARNSPLSARMPPPKRRIRLAEAGKPLLSVEKYACHDTEGAVPPPMVLHSMVERGRGISKVRFRFSLSIAQWPDCLGSRLANANTIVTSSIRIVAAQALVAFAEEPSTPPFQGLVHGP